MKALVDLHRLAIVVNVIQPTSLCDLEPMPVPRVLSIDVHSRATCCVFVCAFLLMT